MLNVREALIDVYIESQLANTSSGTNYDVYDKRLTKTPYPTPGFEYVPYCIYFYYVRLDTDGKVRVDHYFWPSTPPSTWQPIPHHEVPNHMYNLAINARPSTVVKDPPKLPSNNFDPIPWTRKSYIALFVDEANWHLARRTNGRPSVVFDVGSGEANHTFFDAIDWTFDMPTSVPSVTDQRSGIYFVNHMKGSDGADLGYDPEVFKFNMNFTAQSANSSTTGAYISFDPGGTNQGPPETP